MDSVSRQLFPNLLQHLSAKQFTILTGARQTGKSTLLLQLYNHLIKSGQTSALITFEDPTILNAINEHPERLFDFVPRPVGDKRVYILIDEVQYATNPTNFLKLLYDKYAPALKIIATGSSAFYLDTKFKDSLAGRKQIFELYTLSFDEFIDFRTRDQSLMQELDRMRNEPQYVGYRRPEIETLFGEYLTYGGYPAVVLANTEQKPVLLKELVNTYVKRDIVESKVQDELRFFNLFAMLARQTGSLLNVFELGKMLRLSSTAVENYLYIMQKSFHITLVRPFYGNISKELVKMPKIFFNDLGLRNMLSNQLNPVNQRADRGEIVENYVFIRLRQLYGTDEIRFWRTADGNEVDFVLPNLFEKSFAVEAKYSSTEFKPSKYKKFTENYPQFPLSCWAYELKGNQGNIMCQ
jgi:uncharacterized protein